MFLQTNTKLSIVIYAVLSIHLGFATTLGHAASPNVQQKANCNEKHAGFIQIMHSYFASQSKLSVEQTEIRKAVLNCRKGFKPKPTSQYINEFKAKHSNNVLAILGSSESDKPRSINHLSGIKYSFKEKGVQKKLIVKAVKSNTLSVNQLINYYLEYKPSVIISNISLVAENAHRVISELKLPWVYIRQLDSSLEKTAQHNPWIHIIYPSLEFNAKYLARSAAKDGIAKMVVLSPQGGLAKGFIEPFTQAFQKFGGKITKIISYDSHSYHSMNAAITQLFELDPVLRPDEYSELVVAAQLQAEEKGMSFNQDSITLPPKLDANGVLIPDNFKVVKNFTGLFKFHNAPKVNIYGTHLWRASQLIEEYDPYLQFAKFVDYIGLYTDLPFIKALAPTKTNPYFLEGPTISKIDHIHIAYMAASIVTNAIGARGPEKSKWQISKTISREINDNLARRWPSYIFSIVGKKIHLTDSSIKMPHSKNNHRQKAL